MNLFTGIIFVFGVCFVSTILVAGRLALAATLKRNRRRHQLGRWLKFHRQIF